MPICHDRKFIFFRIPRCGGTSFESFFELTDQASLYGVEQQGSRTLTLQHLTAVDLIQEGLVDNDTLQRYFKFTVIRDPFDRMASDFYWQQKHDVHGEFAHLDFFGYLEVA